MEKTKKYTNTIFSVEAIKKAIEEFDNSVKEEELKRIQWLHRNVKNRTDQEIFFEIFRRTMTIQLDDETWEYDSEDEFFADYRKYNNEKRSINFTYQRNREISRMSISSYSIPNTSVSVMIHECPGNRSIIERIFVIFEVDAPKSKLDFESVKKPKIFIGHGRNTLWRDLKDHLQDKHSHDIVAYEVGARAGHAIRDILESLLSESYFALLVMTAEDETADGRFRARQNVVHEIGLFQGKLGFNRVIILLEEGTEEFSNIHGIEQIRFSKNNIKETYGDILATIKREFY